MRDHLGKKAASLGSAVGLVVAAMALPAFAQQSFQSQLLVNPGFESPTDSSGNNTDTTVAGWSLYGNAVRANFENHTPGGEWMIWLQTFDSYGGVYQDVQPITAGTTYNLSAYWYFEANEPAVPGLVTDMALTFLNASDQPVGPTDANGFSDATYIPASSVTTTDAWVQYTLSGVAPTGATAVQVSFDFMNGSNGNTQGAFVDDADLSGEGVPQNTAQWAVAGSGDWNSSGNWTTGSTPNAVGAEADFFGSITSSPETVYTNAAITAGTLHFNNPNEYVIAGAPTLTLQTTAGNALVQVDQGTDELDLPVTIASNTTFNVAAGATLLVANPVTINSGETLSSTGGGTVTYQSIISVGNAASIAFANSTHASELSLASGANASVGGSGTVLEVNTLANSGTINLENNELLINYGSSADPVATVRAELQTGYANGNWNGAGIDTSSTTGTKYALGYADGADGGIAGATSGQVEVKYTLYGDTNLDGTVNSIDFGNLAANFGKSDKVWDQGDFNYDGTVNSIDFGLLAGNFGKSVGGASVAISSADWAALDAFAAANGLMADVPEPVSTALFAVAGLGLMAKRRRR